MWASVVSTWATWTLDSSMTLYSPWAWGGPSRSVVANGKFSAIEWIWIIYYCIYIYIYIHRCNILYINWYDHSCSSTVVSCRIWVILSQSDWDLVGLVSKRNLLKLLKWGILWQSLADKKQILSRTKPLLKASNPWTVMQWCRQYYTSLMGNYDKLVMSPGPSSECSATQQCEAMWIKAHLELQTSARISFSLRRGIGENLEVAGCCDWHEAGPGEPQMCSWMRIPWIARHSRLQLWLWPTFRLDHQNLSGTAGLADEVRGRSLQMLKQRPSMPARGA